MRVALVYHGRYHVRQALELETLAVVIRNGGHELAFVYDPDTFGVTDNVLQIRWLARLIAAPDRVVRRIVDAHADIVVFSVLPNTYAWARDIARRVRAAAPTPILFIGLHPSLVPERVMQDAFVDYVIQGECEAVINPLIEAAGAGRTVCEIGSLWYRQDGAVRHTARADLVDLDRLPLPDKELFRPYVSHAYSYAAMVSRGCPYQCTFCEETCAKKVHGPKYFRRRSVDAVMAELVAAKRRYGFREMIFKDSYLSGDRTWLEELMRRYRAEIGVPFKCFCTILGFDEDTARLLKEGGCYCIEFGLQTWNERLRREVLNRRETNEAAFRVFDLCATHKLWYDVDHMFNLPGETQGDHREGVACYRKLKCLNRVKVHFLVYLPTAGILDHAREAGILPEDVDAKLAEGWESDFYDQGTGTKQERATVAGFAALYKLLPILPQAAVRWLLRGNRVRLMRWIPGPIMALLQGLMAWRSGDLRFSTYLRIYPIKVWRTWVERG
ncbi:MAG: radical SAM protein [Kiritimatiellae bacterium]|nr:radical SAM protein [Kiritimatiellia bacterium]